MSEYIIAVMSQHCLASFWRQANIRISWQLGVLCLQQLRAETDEAINQQGPHTTRNLLPIKPCNSCCLYEALWSSPGCHDVLQSAEAFCGGILEAFLIRNTDQSLIKANKIQSFHDSLWENCHNWQSGEPMATLWQSNGKLVASKWQLMAPSTSLIANINRGAVK